MALGSGQAQLEERLNDAHELLSLMDKNIRVTRSFAEAIHGFVAMIQP